MSNVTTDVLGVGNAIVDVLTNADDRFLQENELPWKQLFSEDPEAQGMDHPMATHYGVMGIPTLILVGPDGKVVSLEARGEELGANLEELLGPPDESTVEAAKTGT